MTSLWVFLFTIFVFTVVKTKEELNNRPIIGILTQEISYNLNKTYPNQYHSYIAASYVKFVEGAGARAVPIWIGGNTLYYKDILSKVNGVLWPGGSTYFSQEAGYADAGAKIYRIVKRINEEGTYFPIFGICLGFELLTYVAANRVAHRTHCSSNNQRLPLEFTPGYRESKLFKNAPLNVLRVLSEQNVTANYHHLCVTKKALRHVNLTDEFHVLSLNHDENGLEFISILEHKQFPFYGLQFHPEKNLYEWVIGKRIPHSISATIASQYFANFFVNEARKNFNEFRKQEEQQSLIYNYPVIYTALQNSSFQQCYMFKKSDRNNRFSYRNLQSIKLTTFLEHQEILFNQSSDLLTSNFRSTVEFITGLFTQFPTLVIRLYIGNITAFLLLYN